MASKVTPLEKFSQNFEIGSKIPPNKQIPLEDSLKNVKRKKGKKKKSKVPAISKVTGYRQITNLNDMDRTFDSKSSSSSVDKTEAKPAKKKKDPKPPTDPNDLFVIEDYNDNSHINLNGNYSLSPVPHYPILANKNPKLRPKKRVNSRNL